MCQSAFDKGESAVKGRGWDFGEPVRPIRSTRKQKALKGNDWNILVCLNNLYYFLEEWHSLCEWEHWDHRYSPGGQREPSHLTQWNWNLTCHHVRFLYFLIRSCAWVLVLHALDAARSTVMDALVRSSVEVNRSLSAPGHTQNNPETQTESETKLT